MNITIRNIDTQLYREIKAEATREGINIGTAINSAIRLWLNRKRAQVRPGRSFLELESMDFGPGTENLSEEHDKYLYGE
ncbi:MAG: hypothetical protein K0A89_06570 [ANME-2 cluster archaeon]|nr:hypothetical protein [ANME-2 cluster archaeon]